jgi:hypothetical protein
MVSAIYQKRAFPIFWTLLDKQGPSNLADQQQVLRPVITIFKKNKLIIIGDAGISLYRVSTSSYTVRISALYSVKNVRRLSLEKRQPFQSLNSIPV